MTAAHDRKWPWAVVVALLMTCCSSEAPPPTADAEPLTDLGAAVDADAVVDATTDVDVTTDVTTDVAADMAADSTATDVTNPPSDATGTDAGGTDAGVTDDGITDATDASGDVKADGQSAPAGDGACFHGAPPSPDAYVADIPEPSSAQCQWTAPKFFPDKAPAPSLKVEVGTHDPATGAFVPYSDGQWLPMVHGPQGGFHVFAAIRVQLPGQSAAVVKMQSEAIGWIDCKEVALGQQPVIFVKPDKGGGYTTATLSHAGTLVIFPVQSKDSWQYCGKWIELMVRVKDVVSGAWGQTHLTVRLFDTKDAPLP